MEEQQVAEQSHVFEDQEQFQAPPELLREPTEEEKQKKKKQKMWVLILTGTAIFFLVAMILVMYISSLPQPEVVAEPTPTPVPDSGPSKMEVELKRLEDVVMDADPATEPFAPPPVDMEVSFDEE